MLVLRRNEGQWTEIVHAASGDVLRIRTVRIEPESEFPASVELVFDDAPRHFAMRRPERVFRRSEERRPLPD